MNRIELSVLKACVIAASLFASGNSSIGHRAHGVEPPNFAKDVLPILQKNCFACHNLQKTEGKLNLESVATLTRGGESGASIVVGKSAESEIIQRVQPDSTAIMPPDGNAVGAKRLTPEEISILVKWIDGGAPSGEATQAPMAWQTLPDSIKPIYALAGTPDGQFVVVGRGNHATVYRWPAVDGMSDAVQLVDPATQSQLHSQSPVAHLDFVQSVAIHPDGRRIATGGYRDVKIWKREIGPIEDALTAILKGSLSVVPSPDGRWIARTTTNSEIELVRTDNSAPSVRSPLSAGVTSMTWSQNSNEILVSCADGMLHVLTLSQADSNSPPTLSVREAQKLEASFASMVSFEGRMIVGLTADRKLQQWTFEQPNPDQPRVWQRTDRWQDQIEVVSIAQYYDPAPKLVIGIADGSLRVASLQDGAMIRTIAHGSTLMRVLSSPDNSKLVSIGADGSMKAWNTSDGNMRWEHRLDIEQEKNIQLAELKSARQQTKVDRVNAKIPELEKGKQAEIDSREKLQKNRTDAMEAVNKKQTELEANSKQVTESEAAVAAALLAVEEATKKVEQSRKDLEAKKAQKMVAEKAKLDAEMKVATIDKTIANASQAVDRAVAAIAQFQSMLEQEKMQLGTLQTSAAQAKASAATSPVVAAVMSHDGKSVAAVHPSGLIEVLRSDNGVAQASLPSGIGNVSAVLMSSSSNVYALSADGQVRGWVTGNHWQLERVIGNAEQSPFSDRVTALDFSADGSKLAIGSGAPSRFGELKLFNVEDGAMLRDFGPVHSDSIMCVKFSPDEKWIATGAADKLVRIHSLVDERPAKTFEGHTHHVLGIAWHDDGYWFASCSADNSIKVWDLEAGQVVRSIAGFGKEVTSLSFVGRTNQVFSTSADQQARLHDASNGNLIRAIPGAADAIYASTVVGKTPIGIAGGQDGTLWVWQLDNGQALQQIK